MANFKPLKSTQNKTTMKMKRTSKSPVIGLLQNPEQKLDFLSEMSEQILTWNPSAAENDRKKCKSAFDSTTKEAEAPLPFERGERKRDERERERGANPHFEERARKVDKTHWLRRRAFKSVLTY